MEGTFRVIIVDIIILKFECCEEHLIGSTNAFRIRRWFVIVFERLSTIVFNLVTGFAAVMVSVRILDLFGCWKRFFTIFAFCFGSIVKEDGMGVYVF